MYCRKCGTEIPDDSVFCVKCGTPVEGAAEQTKKEEQAPIRTEVASRVYTPPKKKKKTGLVIAFAAIGLALVMAGLYFFFLKGANGSSGDKIPVIGQKQVSILEDKDKLAEITASVLKLECYDDEGALYATGSGFVAFSGDLIITNFHVIEDHPYSIKALSEDGRKFDVEGIITYNQEMDIAILKTKGSTNLAPLTFAEKAVEKTDKVVAIGSPLGLMNTVSDGIVSGFTQVGNESVIQFTASISHGSSGGVLLNDAGEVVGVTFASFTEGQNLNVAIPISYVSALYSREGNKQTKTIQAFYNEVDHTKTYSIDEVRTNQSKHKNEIMNVYGYLFIRGTYSGDKYYLVNDSNVYNELIERREKIKAYQKKTIKEQQTPTAEETAAYYSNSDKFNALLDSEAVLSLNLDSYKLPSKISSGSCVIVHGKLNSDGVFVVDSIDYYN